MSLDGMLAALRTAQEEGYGDDGCIFCGRGEPAPVDRMDEREHSDDCPMSFVEAAIKQVEEAS